MLMRSILRLRVRGRRGRGLRGKRKIVAGGERTGFAAVKEERCGLCVKASEEKMELEERVKQAEAELRETKMEVVALREGRDDDDIGGGEEEGIEDEVVVVPAASTTTELRDRSSGKKRQTAAQVEEQPRNVKKVKTALRKGKKVGGRFVWTADENAALLELVDEYGLDFDRIKTEAGARLGGRKAKAIENNFRNHRPDRYEELRATNPRKSGGYLPWSKEEDEALKRGRLKHGADYEKILETENEVLGWRTTNALQVHHSRLLNKKIA
ncbi:hypothetical protein TL16_g01282 [Triparma laevis f. inornata]|uniref:Myb-like domain-containing protein n=1 Tax=Triparma laevis f. inornata TaxID=1714386 RepID=A0A9W6ZLZ4_9STRA|nr:hypothetical protein TL16_g01282 [Triparma laevis f. inornata]